MGPVSCNWLSNNVRIYIFSSETQVCIVILEVFFKSKLVMGIRTWKPKLRGKNPTCLLPKQSRLESNLNPTWTRLKPELNQTQPNQNPSLKRTSTLFHNFCLVLLTTSNEKCTTCCRVQSTTYYYDSLKNRDKNPLKTRKTKIQLCNSMKNLV